MSFKTLEDQVEYYAARAMELEAALAEAIDLAEEGWQYAPAYFQDKYDCADQIAILRGILRGCP